MAYRWIYQQERKADRATAEVKTLYTKMAHLSNQINELKPGTNLREELEV